MRKVKLKTIKQILEENPDYYFDKYGYINGVGGDTIAPKMFSFFGNMIELDKDNCDNTGWYYKYRKNWIDHEIEEPKIERRWECILQGVRLKDLNAYVTHVRWGNEKDVSEFKSLKTDRWVDVNLNTGEIINTSWGME